MKKNIEVWKYIKGYNKKYEISNFGRLRSWNYGGRLLGYGHDTRGYITISLCKNSKSKTLKLHRVVAETFLANPLKLKEVNHIDSNRKNNSVDNLEWCTHKQNMEHASKNNRIFKPNGEKSHFAKLNEEKVRLIRKNVYRENYQQLAERFGVTNKNISYIIRKLTWKHI